MIVLNDNKQIFWLDCLIIFASSLFFSFMMLWEIQANTYIEFGLCILFGLIIFIALLYAYLLRTKVIFDQENITIEKYIFSYRIKGKQGRVKAIKEWYLYDTNEGKGKDLLLNIVFNNGNKIVIEDSRYDDFHELRRFLNFDEFYKSKMTLHRK